MPVGPPSLDVDLTGAVSSTETPSSFERELHSATNRRASRSRVSWMTLGSQIALTVAAILIAGYHTGIEDDAIYLPAIKKLLNPALYPHDTPFFASQTKGFFLLRVIAASVRFTHLPLEWILLSWQFASIFLMIAGCWYVVSQCFSDWKDCFAAVALVSAVLTIPVAATGLYIADQHLHPRTLACAAIVFATGALLDHRRKLALVCWCFALFLHPFMAMFGVILLICLALPSRWLQLGHASTLINLPLPFITQQNAAWKEAVLTRTSVFLWTWKWYEWLGVFAPIALLSWFARISEKIGSATLSRLCRRLVLFSVVMSMAALVVGIPQRFQWLAEIQPMRHLQLVYLFLMLVAGGLLSRYVLRNHIWRWLTLFVPLCGGMLYAQDQTFATSSHIELPGIATTNRWVRCFLWIRQNTPQDAYFAVDPEYMNRPDEENYGFRGIAERSKLADRTKDPAVIAITPNLAPTWKMQVDAMRNYRDFTRQDFLELREKFGTDWALVETEIPGLSCPYRQDHLAVCRIE